MEPEYQGNVDISSLKNALEESWSAETSVDPENWSSDNPAYGQCAATAAVVQDYLGGELLNSYVEVPGKEEDVSHYFNGVDGVVLDFTREQFPEDSVVPMGKEKTKGFETTREYVLSYDSTRDRYQELKDSVEAILEPQA